MASLEGRDLCSTEMIQRHSQSLDQSMRSALPIFTVKASLKFLENVADGGNKGYESDASMRRLCLTGGGQDYAVEELKPLELDW